MVETNNDFWKSVEEIYRGAPEYELGTVEEPDTGTLPVMPQIPQPKPEELKMPKGFLPESPDAGMQAPRAPEPAKMSNELLESISEIYRKSPADMRPEAPPPADKPDRPESAGVIGEFAKGVVSGVAGIGEMAGGALKLVGASEIGEEVRSTYAEGRAPYRGATESYTDIETDNIKDALKTG